MAINIEPGVINTEMQGTIRAASTADFPDVDRFIRLEAEGRLASPADVAERVLQIVSSPSLAQGGRYDVADADRHGTRPS